MFFLILIPIFAAAIFIGWKTWSFVKAPDVIKSTSDISARATSLSTCENSGNIEYLYYYEPLPGEEKNNKFGIYVYAENSDYFEIAQKLVNSNGGDWGYVLIPFNIKDRDITKWGRVFGQLREKHLIPIVQLWDVDPSNYEEDTKKAADFLDTFIWPVRSRYISVYNEPNDAKFWKGKVDPANYAEVLDFTIREFKDENQDFFIINGALNASASDTAESMDAEEFMKLMNDAVPGIFDKLDGWASHSYPQPNFSGSPDDDGRWSIRAYAAELDYLKNSLGVKKDLPVFITETGWAHAEGENYNFSYLSVSEVSKNFKKAFEKVWLKDDRVMAVTPFTIWYEPPFDHFSWINKDKVPYEHYEVVKSIKKVQGNPARLEVGITLSIGCP